MKVSAKIRYLAKLPKRCTKLCGARSPIKHSVKKGGLGFGQNESFAFKALQMRFAERLAFEANRLKSFDEVTEKKG